VRQTWILSLGVINPLLHTCQRRRSPCATAACEPTVTRRENDKEQDEMRGPLSGQEKVNESPIRITSEQVMARRSATHQLYPQPDVHEEEEVVLPRSGRDRQIPFCGILRELFLDRKPWLEADPRMKNHLVQFHSLLQ